MEGNPLPLTQPQHLSVLPGCYTHRLESSQQLTAWRYWQDINVPLSIPLVMEIKRAFAYLFQFPVKENSQFYLDWHLNLSGLCPDQITHHLERERGYFNLSSIAAQGQADRVIDGVRRSGQ